MDLSTFSYSHIYWILRELWVVSGGYNVEKEKEKEAKN